MLSFFACSLPFERGGGGGGRASERATTRPSSALSSALPAPVRPATRAGVSCRETTRQKRGQRGRRALWGSRVRARLSAFERGGGGGGRRAAAAGERASEHKALERPLLGPSCSGSARHEFAVCELADLLQSEAAPGAAPAPARCPHSESRSCLLREGEAVLPSWRRGIIRSQRCCLRDGRHSRGGGKEHEG